MSDKSDNNLDKIIYIILILCSIVLFMFIGTNVHAAAIYGPSGCTSTHYRILKGDGTETFGVTSTSYNISWNAIGFSGTENMDANSYYDVKITFLNNVSMNYFQGFDFFSTSSLCGSTVLADLPTSSISVSGKTVTFRVLTSNMVDYWTVFFAFPYSGSQGISTVTLSKVDLTGSSGIIESNNENTTNIINNNNENTQDIIDNQTQNTQEIINALDNSTFSVCSHGKQYFLIGSDKSYISNNTGRVNPNNNYFVSSPLRIEPNASYTLHIINATNIQYGYYCFYRSDKTLVSCTKYSDNTTLDYTFTSPADSYYFMSTFYRSNDVILNAYLEGQNANICVPDSYSNAIISQKNNITINGINDALTDSTVTSDLIDDIVDSDFYHNDALTSIITAPLTLLNSIIDTNNTCQPLELPFQIKIGSFYDKTSSGASLPCGSILWSHAPNTLVNLYRLIVGGFIIFRVCTYAYLVIDSSIDPFKDKLEVIDL